jgi:HlyD family secretion protein
MARTTALPRDEIQTTLGIDAAGARIRLRPWLIGAVVVAGAVALSVLVVRARGQEAGVQYRTDEVRRGNLTVSVTATGVLKPLTQVNVGTEISGIVDRVAVDFNDHVRVGQVLATINTDRLRAQAHQARASLESARAEVMTAQATLEDAERAAGRARELFERQLVPQSERDAVETALKKAEAALASARARVAQSEASLNAIEADLRKATIRSPIDGIVLDRQVDPGQTVAASFQTPVLFTLARDLSQMTLNVNVDEADIGTVQAGQEGTFTVDAYPTRVFRSRVIDVRSTPKTVSGVVTYETILSVDNSELLLRPGMTATAAITVTHLTDALLVPNAALRFAPPEEAAQPATTEGRGLIGALMPRPGRPGVTRPATAGGPKAPQRVWILREKQPVPIEIAVGATDGAMTQVLSGDLMAGTAVLVDVLTGG